MKVACTVWSGGKVGDSSSYELCIKFLPIAINEDGLEAFALTKDKTLKDFDVKDFEEYFQSGATCWIVKSYSANKSLNILAN